MPRPTPIILYEFAACHDSGQVRRLLRQLDLAYEPRTLVQGDKSVVRREFASESVPVLVDGEFVSHDVREICWHLEATYGAPA
ncbi:MAG TPA: glutathione S-transferase N-terminal domain-containing protein [Candidatus Thermoplasmatota archaeon]|nr:glutathione S-transferase N-terminal domain-containing protein [Candidatus Thermoplasmatota archaeon]